jgi:Fe-S-cluster containining protein
MSAEPKKNNAFFCTQCGGCCHKKNLSQYNLEHWGLEIGADGYCSNLKNSVCTIYEDRPLICRVEEAYDRVEELREIEPQLADVIDRVKVLAPDDAKLEYFKFANVGCNYLIKRLNLGSVYEIDINKVYAEVAMIDIQKRETKKENRENKKESKRDYRIEKIKAVTAKALAVAKKRKWLVFLIGAAIAAYFIFKGGGGGILDISTIDTTELIPRIIEKR